jgi:mono/diheme cytochrome c family protein
MAVLLLIVWSMNLLRPRPILSAALLLTAFAARAEEKGNPSAGMALFTQNCVICHGAEGRGDGPASAGLNPKPANFWERVDSTEERQVRVVTNGGASEKLSPIMPSFGDSLSPQQIRDVVAFVRDRFPAARPGDLTAKK